MTCPIAGGRNLRNLFDQFIARLAALVLLRSDQGAQTSVRCVSNGEWKEEPTMTDVSADNCHLRRWTRNSLQESGSTLNNGWSQKRLSSINQMVEQVVVAGKFKIEAPIE